MSLSEAFKRVEERKEEGIGLLQRIIGINTSSPPGKNYDKLVDLLEPIFRSVGFETKRVVIPEEKIKEIPLPLEGPRVNLVTTKKVGKETVTIYGHMDTVPVEEKWTVDPFAGVVRDGRIYGRGAADMKGSIASLLTALKVMHELDMEPSYDMLCLMCTDEEPGQYPGIYHLALNGYVKGHILCMDGLQDPRISLGAFGELNVIVTTKGKSCHSGINFMGVNAVEQMVPILVKLIELKRMVERRESAIPFPPGLENVPSDKMTPMFNLDMIQGGTAPNIVPAECVLIINRRYIIEEKYENVVDEIERAIDRGKERSKALDVKVSYSHAYPPYKVDPNSEYVRKMKEAHKLVQGYKDEDFVQGGITGSTDMAFVAQVLKTDKFVHSGPGRYEESNIHGADENIRVSDFIAHTKELIYYLTQ